MNRNLDFFVFSIHVAILIACITHSKDIITCGQCAKACPQKIDVPEEMKKLAAAIKKQKSWEEICLEREKAASAEK